MRKLYRVIQSQLTDFYRYTGEEMLEVDKKDLLKHIVEEVLFEIDVRDYAFDDIFVALIAGMNGVFDDYTYSETQILRALNPAYLENITNLLTERR